MTEPLMTELRRAIETDDHKTMKRILDWLRRNNVGEALTPGLRELCKQARQQVGGNNVRSASGGMDDGNSGRAECGQTRATDQGDL